MYGESLRFLPSTKSLPSITLRPKDGIAGAKIIGPESNLTDKALERMLSYLVDNFYITRKHKIHFK